MKKTSKKLLSILLALAILLTAFVIAPTSVLAADSPVTLEGASYKASIWADPENVLTQDSVTNYSANKLALLGGIQPHKVSTSASTFYLFLPSTADCTALKFWFSGTASINGTELVSGQPTDILASINEGGVASSTLSLRVDNTSYNLVAIKSGDVATVYIDTNSGSLKTITDSSHSKSEAGSVMVVQPDGTVDYMGIMEKMSGRGNGTWSTSNTKNPYNFKLAKSTPLLGLPAAKKWVLLANSGDKTLVKNQITYDFSEYIDIKYQPNCKPCDLYVNQQYLGSYQLSEKVEIKSNRINVTDVYDNLEIANGTTDPTTGAVIPADLTGTAVKSYQNSIGTGSDTATTGSSDLFGCTVGNKNYSPSIKNDPSDYTGGYLYELEITQRWMEENAGFCAYNRQGWVLKNCDYATQNMAHYSYDLLYALGGAVYNNGIVPNTKVTTKCNPTKFTIPSLSKTAENPAPAEKYQNKKWSDLLDADSAVRYYWTQEFFKNMDSSTSSTYFFKDSDAVDSKLYAGPVWDMDNALCYEGSASRWGHSYTSTDDWYTKNVRMYRWRTNDSDTGYDTDSKAPLSFYGALATNCKDFWAMAEDYWYEYISPAVEVLNGNKIDETGTLLSISDYVNAVAKSGYMDTVRFGASAYNVDSITSGLTNWVNNRKTWINKQIPTSSISSVNINYIADQTFTGNEIRPDVTVTYNDSVLGNITLTEGLDYELEYVNNIEVGMATIKVNGINGYTDSFSTSFRIVAGSLSDYTLEIDKGAYTDSILTSSLKSTQGNEVATNIAYQWYKDGTAIEDAQQDTYTVKAEDVGSVITLVVTGDGKNLNGSITSNECPVFAGQRPTSYSKTLASWDYDYSLDSTALETADPMGNDFYYLATGGENQSTSNLYASVNATDNAEIKWSGKADLYTNDSTTLATDQAPVIGTSKTNLVAWRQWSYFQTVISTAGYENIKFSAKLGGTKKGPRDWKLQYSLDGENFTDIEGAAYSIKDNKAMELAFDNVQLPAECDNQRTVYIRVTVAADVAINGVNTVINQLSGDAAINNIHITGSSLKVITSLYEPTITPDNGTAIFNDNAVEIKDNNGGADVYYTINDSQPQLYTSPITLFDAKTAKKGDTATVTAYAKFNDIVSETSTAQYTFAGNNIVSFSYSTYSTDVTAGAVQSTGGIYGASGKMTAHTSDTYQYVPLWNDDNKSFAISPDDGDVWSDESGFAYKVTTAGFENITFTAKAYTTLQGPKSVTLQYSDDAVNYYNVQSNVVLPANGALEQVFFTVDLPAACNNKETLYIRLITAEDATNGGASLHNNESKGNLYVNDVTIGGDDMGTLKMPYTNKSTNYFGSNGIIHYISPDGENIQYIILDKNNNVVQNGTYNDVTGIQLSKVAGFNAFTQGKYTVLAWAGDDDDQSLINMRTYYYKGDSVVKFNYNSSTNLFADYVSADSLSVSNTSGANSGTLSMYPNASTAAQLSYTGTYGVKVGWDALINPNDKFAATKILDKPANNGYWLIETSTAGYTDLTLNLEQLSSNKGPRDWGIAYSLNGSSYKYVDNSHARAISNDAISDTVETYGNLPLPAECDNQEKLYIKVFINGGESVKGDELELADKGNTGINGIEISGIKIPEKFTLTVNTTVLESPKATTGTIAQTNVDVYVNGELAGTTDENGALAIAGLTQGEEYNITFGGNGIVERTITKALSADEQINVPVIIFDVNNDGYINAKDYAIINKDSSFNATKQYFENFINTNTSKFNYQ